MAAPSAEVIQVLPAEVIILRPLQVLPHLVRPQDQVQVEVLEEAVVAVAAAEEVAEEVVNIYRDSIS